jgi:hypothetical protein
MMLPAGVVSISTLIERKPVPPADLLHDVEQVLQQSRQAIELPDRHPVARSEVVQEPVQVRPVPSGRPDAFLDEARAQRRGQHSMRRRQDLTLAGDAATARHSLLVTRFSTSARSTSGSRRSGIAALEAVPWIEDGPWRVTK